MTGNGCPLPEWFAPLCAEIERELQRLSHTQPDRRSGLGEGVTTPQESIPGWAQSLAKPDLSPIVREDLEAQYVEAKTRLQELEVALMALEGQSAQRQHVLDPAMALARLHRLADVLASGNVTLGNLELGRHIDRID